MALTRDFKETLLAGDVDTGKAVLRDYIKATVGFERLGTETGSSPKSLIRMLGPTGNPQARNLFAVISRHQPPAAGRQAHPAGDGAASMSGARGVDVLGEGSAITARRMSVSRVVGIHT